MVYISSKIHPFILAFFLIFATTVYAAETDSLKHLLIDLNNWDAEKPEDMSMDMGEMKMTSATRNYTQDKKEITTMIMIGTNAMTQGHMQQMNVESEEAKVSVATIDGFQTHTSYDKKENSGALIVFLSNSKTQGAMFMFSFKGISEKDALSLSKKFNWEKMKASVEKLF
jgi:hypothetical protein